MRQFYKKISSVCMALLCVAALLIGCTATAWAADEIDDSVKSQLVTTTKGLTDAIIAMSEDDIQGYLESEDAFTQSAASAWDGSREELGEKKGDINEKDITVEYSDDQYTVVVPVSFEKNKANFTYVFDKSGTPTSLTVDVNYTLAQNMEKAAEYKELQNGIASAAARGYVDTVIKAEDTRKYVIGAFEMLFTKREDRPSKKIIASADAGLKAFGTNDVVRSLAVDGVLIVLLRMEG